MSSPNPPPRLSEWMEFLRKWLPFGLVLSSFLSLGWVQTFGDGVQSGLQNYMGITEVRRQTTINTRAILAMSRPSDVFEISDRSRPLQGYCIEGKDCRHNVRVRRNEDALSCEIVPGTFRYYYRNPRTNEVYDVGVVSGRPRDLGTSYINMQFILTTPSNLIPNAELCVRPEYVKCPGMSENDAPINPDEECFDVEIITMSEANLREE